VGENQFNYCFVDGLNTSLCDLSMEVVHQLHISERLTSSLHSQQHLLEATIMESRRELEKQHYILSKQQAVVEVSHDPV
jgi:hypothetical protein